MTQLKLNAIFNAAAILPAIVGLSSALFMAYVFLWPLNPAYEPIHAENHRVTYTNGYIRIHREYCIHAVIPITISRDLIRIGSKDEPELRINLPQTVQLYEMGCHDIDRIFEVPRGTPPGNYLLVNTAVWPANPFRDDSVRLPVLSLAIPPEAN